MTISTDTKTLIETLFYLIITVIMPVLATYFVQLMDKKTKEIVKDMDDTAMTKAIDTAEKLVAKVVTQTAQTYSDACKENAKDGKLTKEQAQKAFDTTRNTIYVLLSDEARKYIAYAYGNVDKWLATQIEVAVAQRNSGNLIIDK